MDALEAAEAKLRRGSMRQEGRGNDMSESDTGIREDEVHRPALHDVADPVEKARCRDEIDVPAKVDSKAPEVLREPLRVPNQDVVRLLRERAALLRTGVYQRGDKVIIALENEIEKRSGEKHEV